MGAVGTIINIVTLGAAAARKHSENSALAQVRRENGECLHILIKGGFLGNTVHDTSAEREINLKRGMLFGALGHTFYHPNPHFTPNNKVEWLSRSQWKDGGLDPEHNIFPVRADGSYQGYFSRGISGDRGGGETRVGYCVFCAKETELIGE